MKGFKPQNFADRLSTSQSARQSALERLKPKLDPNDPRAIERRAERLAIAEARVVRAQQREEARVAELKRVEEERIARELAEAAEREAQRERDAKEQEMLRLAQKAARDARYAARKARGKKRV